MSDEPIKRAESLPEELDLFGEATVGSGDEAFLADFSDDARLGSGVPDSQRLSEDDFVALSGIIRPRPATSTPAKVEEPDTGEDSRPISFAEEGVADVEETDESEPLERGEVILPEETIEEAEPASEVDSEPEQTEFEADEAGHSQAIEAMQPDEPIAADVSIASVEELDEDYSPETPLPEAELDGTSNDVAGEEDEPESVTDSASVASDIGRLFEEFKAKAGEPLAEEATPELDDLAAAEASAEPEVKPEPEVAADLKVAEKLPTTVQAAPMRTRLEEAEYFLQMLAAKPAPEPERDLSAESDEALAMDEEPSVEPQAIEPEFIEEQEYEEKSVADNLEFPADPLDEEPEVVLPVEELEPEPAVTRERTPAEVFEESLEAVTVDLPAPPPDSFDEILDTYAAVPVEAIEPAREPEPEIAAEVESPVEPVPSKPIAEAIAKRIEAYTPEVAIQTGEALPQRPLAVDEPTLLSTQTPPPKGDPGPTRHGHLEYEYDAAPTRRHTTRHVRRRQRFLLRVAIVLTITAVCVCGYVAYRELVAPRILSPDELFAKASRQLSDRQFTAASSTFAELVRRAPNHPGRPDAQFYSGLALHMSPEANAEMRRAQAEQAVKYLEQFVRDNPAHKKLPRARSLLGILYYEVGDYTRAIEELRSLLKQTDDQLAGLPLLRTLARAYGKSGALKEAESTYLQAASSPKNYTPDTDYFELGELYKRRADVEENAETRATLEAEATKYFTLAMESQVVDPETRNSIGEVILTVSHEPDTALAVDASEPAELPAQTPETMTTLPVEAGTPPDPEIPVASGQMVDPVLEAQQLGQEAVVQP